MTTNELKPKTSHDSDVPPNLLNFMMKDWKPAAKKAPKPIKNHLFFKARRESLSRRFPGEVLIIPTGHMKVRSNDTYFRFRPSSDFYYLTGCQEPDCVLVLVPESDGHRTVLFAEPNPGRTDATFFTDRVKGELWEGPRPGLPEFQGFYHIQDVRPLSELHDFVRQNISGHFRVSRGYSEKLEVLVDGVHPEHLRADQVKKDKELASTLSEMRLLKDKEEVRALSGAIASTKRGFEDVIKRMKSAKIERELEGVFYTRARTEGNDVGYYSIVASGAHACVLHWKQNDGKLKKGDLLLLDAGIEGNELYTADITRTLPVSGRFSKEQKEIYELVLSAQQTAMKAVKPGNDFMEPNRAAMKVLAHGLEKLGILPTSAEEALKDENQFYRRYSLHNVSHMLGLDVHDCAQARAETYKFGQLKAGMVLTIEPGLYFQTDDLTVPAKYRGIGIRIEDDVLVTDRGFKNLSANIPTKTADVERWIKSVWKKK